MAAPRDAGETPPGHEADTEVALTGYDPYIVAITGGAAAGTLEATTTTVAATDESRESRKARLMTWLRDHGA
jgi:hypothetical protein